MVEGPPGPTRTAWKAAEAALTLVAAALARQAIARFLTDGPDKKEPTTASSQAAATSSPAGEQAYSGFSSIKERVP